MIDITENMEHSLLLQLCCSLCKNYLTIPPIRMDANGNSTCGRCKTDVGVFIHNIHYENLVRNFIFPCRFQTEGCSIKEHFYKMKAHEDTCSYQIIKCKVKDCIWEGTVIELIIHHNVNHQELIIINDCVKQLPGDDGCFLLVMNKFYFLILWNYHNYTLRLNVKCLNLMDLKNNVVFAYQVSTIDTDNSFKISNFCQLHDNAIINVNNFSKDQPLMASYITLSITASIPNSIIEKKEEDLNKIICPICSLQMVPPILKCPFGHVTCVDCMQTPSYDFCTTCEEYTPQFARIPELEQIAASSQYTCKWEGCRTNLISVREIQAHQQVCSKRVHKCYQCRLIGSLSQIVCHYSTCTQKKFVGRVILDTKLTILVSDISKDLKKKKKHYTLIAHKEIFWLRFQPDYAQIRISICNYAPLSLENWYRYEADVQHITDVNCPFNKTYYIQIRSNEYFDVPVDHIAQFGGPQFCKITFRIIMLNNQERSRNVFGNFVLLNSY